MTNESTISALKAAIRQLEAQKRQIEEQYRALVTTLRYFENPERRVEPPEELPSSPIPTQTNFKSSEGRLEPQRQRAENDLRNAMADVLAREGQLHRQDIHDRLVERGVYIGGRDPVNNVGAHLSIDPRFKNVGRGIWALVGLPEEANQPERFGTNAESDDTDDGLDDDDGHDSDEEDSVPW